MAKDVRKFSDFSMVFQPHPVTGELKKLENEDAVKRSIRNIVMTNFYEVPFMPNFGCGVRQRLFENITVSTRHQIISDIETALGQYEKRAKVLNVDVILSPDRNGIQVEIVFEIIGIDEPIKVSMFLERVR
jgi:phage baseplate assembly protein W